MVKVIELNLFFQQYCSYAYFIQIGIVKLINTEYGYGDREDRAICLCAYVR